MKLVLWASFLEFHHNNCIEATQTSRQENSCRVGVPLNGVGGFYYFEYRFLELV